MILWEKEEQRVFSSTWDIFLLSKTPFHSSDQLGINNRGSLRPHACLSALNSHRIYSRMDLNEGGQLSSQTHGGRQRKGNTLGGDWRREKNWENVRNPRNSICFQSMTLRKTELHKYNVTWDQDIWFFFFFFYEIAFTPSAVFSMYTMHISS